MANFALLIVDLQKDFFDCRSGVGHLGKAMGIPATRLILKYARNRQWKILHVVTVHSGSSSLPVHLQRTGIKPYCLAGTEGVEIVQGLQFDGDELVRKQNYSGFHETDLKKRLQDISSVVITGIAADCCILHTACGAAALGKQVYVPYQAIGASHVEEYAYGLYFLAKSCGMVVDLHRLLDADEPSLELSIPSDQVTDTVSRWWSYTQNEISKAQIESSALPIDRALELLEQRFPNVSH